jgi:hypothetical protein
MEKANQPCIALVITILSSCMKCHREYTKPSFIHDSKSLFFFQLAVSNIYYYCCCRFIDGGRLFAKQEVKVILHGPKGLGLFFTGDQTGLVTVWRWLPKSKE